MLLCYGLSVGVLSARPCLHSFDFFSPLLHVVFRLFLFSVLSCFHLSIFCFLIYGFFFFTYFVFICYFIFGISSCSCHLFILFSRIRLFLAYFFAFVIYFSLPLSRLGFLPLCYYLLHSSQFSSVFSPPKTLLYSFFPSFNSFYSLTLTVTLPTVDSPICSRIFKILGRLCKTDGGKEKKGNKEGRKEEWKRVETGKKGWE